MEKELIIAVCDFFKKEKMRYALIGGLALHTYGYSRFTTDADFITDSDNQNALIGYLDSLGFTLLQKDSAFSLHILASRRIDLMYIDRATADILFSQVNYRNLDDIVLPVLSPLHLSMLKGFAASEDRTRSRDLDDIRQLYRLGRISIDELKQIAGKYGHEAFFRSELSIHEGSCNERQ